MPDPTRMGERPLRSDALRSVLGHYPTGVVLVTAPPPASEHSPLGMIFGSFTSVSLDPPLVGLLPARASDSWARIKSAGRFCVNVLAADQQDVCEAFTTKSDRRWTMPITTSPSGCPVLADALAWIDCEPASQTGAGDHWFVTGAVHALGVIRSAPPLVFLRGQFTTCDS